MFDRASGGDTADTYRYVHDPNETALEDTSGLPWEMTLFTDPNHRQPFALNAFETSTAIDVENYFSPGGASSLVVHDVASSDTDAATAELRSDGRTIFVQLQRWHTETVTVTFTVGTDEAADAADRAHGSFNVVIGGQQLNEAPEASRTIPGAVTLHSVSPYVIDLGHYFRDPNNDAMTFTGSVQGPAGQFSLTFDGSRATLRYVGLSAQRRGIGHGAGALAGDRSTRPVGDAKPDDHLAQRMIRRGLLPRRPNRSCARIC